MELIYTVTLPYDALWAASEWAYKNCPHYVGNDLHNKEDPFRIDHYFTCEKEASLFALKWIV